MTNSYTTGLLIYVDVLGFKEQVQEHTADQIRNTLAVLSRATTPDPAVAELWDQSRFAFSDHVVRVTNLLSESNQKYRPGILFGELLALVHAQAELAMEGILIRGSATLGEIYARDSMIFGPALIRAYELESKVALYPRVIIDPKVLAALTDIPSLGYFLHTASTDRKYAEDLLRTDFDGTRFLDYCTVMRGECESAAEWEQFMLAHRNMIADRASSHGGKLSSQSAKIGWLARYHDDVVKDLCPKKLQCSLLVRKPRAIKGES